MPRCEGTPPLTPIKDLAPSKDGRVPPNHVLLEGETALRILVSAPETGVRYGNFWFNTKDEPIDVTPRELAGLRTEGRLAIVVPGDLANETVEKDNRIAALLQERTILRGRIVELEGQVRDRDALLVKAQKDLDEATLPVTGRGPMTTTEPRASDDERQPRGRKAA